MHVLVRRVASLAMDEECGKTKDPFGGRAIFSKTLSRCLLVQCYSTVRTRSPSSFEQQHFTGLSLRVNEVDPMMMMMTAIFFLALLPPFLSGNPATATVEMLWLGLIFMAITQT